MVVVIEHNAVVRLAVCELLQLGCGLQTVAYASAREALDDDALGTARLVLVNMGVEAHTRNSHTIIEHVQGNDLGVPIVVMSGLFRSDETELRARAGAMGVAACLPKPLPTDFTERISALLA